MTFFTAHKTGWLLRIKLAPNAAVCALRGTFINADGSVYLKAAVNSVPEKGKANKELIKMLAKALKIPAGSIEIISGHTDHLKKIYLDIPQTDEFKNKLAALNKEQ